MKIRFMTLLFAPFLLSACIAVVIAGAAASLIVYDQRSMVTLEKDARIFHRLHNMLVADPLFHDSHLSVTSFNQTVLLVGQTPRASLRDIAERRARQAPYVRHVYNQITINKPISFSERAKDSLITSEIRSLLLAEKGLQSGSIRIVSEGGVVYLMGTVTQEQANIAVNVARRVEGVNRVVKAFQ